MINSKILAQVLVKLQKKKDSDKAIDNFFAYLKNKNFLNLLPQIKKEVKKQLEIDNSKTSLTIITKFSLSKQQKDKIISLVGAGEDVIIEEKIDINIMGGFMVRYRGKIYDGSLKNQIIQLKKKLNNSY